VKQTGEFQRNKKSSFSKKSTSIIKTDILILIFPL